MATKTKRASGKKTAPYYRNNRMTIAVDALAALDQKRFRPAEGLFLSRGRKLVGNEMKLVPVVTKRDVGKDLQEVLLGTKVCEVCAVGGLFAAAVLAHDHFPVTQEMSGERASEHDLTRAGIAIWEYMEEFFDIEQLDLIEYAFEGGAGGVRIYDLDLADNFQVRLAGLFYEQYDKPKDRFRAIMENIIRNNGEFKLTVL